MFPNYAMMEQCYKMWSDMFNRQCFLEFKDKQKAKKVMEKYK